MLKVGFIHILLICVLSACSDIKEDNGNSFASNNLAQINCFVPVHLGSIPQINLLNNIYNKHQIDHYIVDGTVDSENWKQGYWVIQDVKNNLSYQGSFRNNRLEGWWEIWSVNQLVCAGHYAQNMKQGYWRYLPVGRNHSAKYLTYVNDTMEGLAREYSSDSVLFTEGNYVKGLKNGWWRNYDNIGKISQEANYAKGQIAGYVIKYLNGKKVGEGQQFNGKKWGVWKYFDDKEKLIKIEEFDDY